MSSILAEARAKTLTDKLFNDVSNKLASKQPIGAKDYAHDWWLKHHWELIGLSVTEVMSIFKAAKKRATLAEKYDAIVASMTWKERIKFLELGVEQLKYANSQKLRTMALIGALIRTAPKIISIILMVI